MQTRNGEWDTFENTVALEVQNNMKISVWWTDLYRGWRLTSDSWLNVQGSNLSPDTEAYASVASMTEPFDTAREQAGVTVVASGG